MTEPNAIRCPVCEGKGLVPYGFYTVIGQPYFSSTNTAPETCKSCGGRGIIWRNDD